MRTDGVEQRVEADAGASDGASLLNWVFAAYEAKRYMTRATSAPPSVALVTLLLGAVACGPGRPEADLKPGTPETMVFQRLGTPYMTLTRAGNADIDSILRAAGRPCQPDQVFAEHFYRYPFTWRHPFEGEAVLVFMRSDRTVACVHRDVLTALSLRSQESN